MAITGIDSVIAALANPSTHYTLPFSFPNNSSTSGFLHNLNMSSGWNTSGNSWGYLPSTNMLYSSGGANISSSSYGFPKIPDAASGKNNYIAKISYESTSPGSALFLDLLWCCSGLSAQATTLQTIATPPSLPRNTSGVGNRIYLHFFSAPGLNLAAVTVKYTNSDGVSDRTGTAFLSSSTNVNRDILVSLQEGDIGVLSVQSIQFASATGSAGNVGVYIARPLTGYIAAQTAGQMYTYNFVDVGLPKIENGTALMIQMLSAFSGTGFISGSVDIIVA